MNSLHSLAAFQILLSSAEAVSPACAVLDRHEI